MNPPHHHHQHNSNNALAPYTPQHSHGGYTMQNVDVSSGLLIAHEGSGVLMPQVCVSCGSSERGGELLNRKLYWSPKWTYATLLISPLLFFLCYYAARKNLQAQYYLCPRCAERARKVRVGTSVGWLALLGSVGLAFVAGSAEVVIMSSFVVFFAMLLLAMIGRAPLRITSFQEGRFILQAKAAAYAERIGAPLQLQQPPYPPQQAMASLPHTPMHAPATPQHPPHAAPAYPQHPPHHTPPQPPVTRPNPDGTDGDI